MRADLLLDNFHALAEAPSGIQKLRGLILELAFRGKLEPQDSNDNPASELLQEMKKEKEQFVKDRKLRHSELPPPILEGEAPYQLPEGWVWARLAEVSHDWGQKEPDKRFTYIDVSSIDKERGVVSEDVKVLDAEVAPSRARRKVREGTVIYSTVRPYLLNTAIIGTKITPEPIVSTAFAILHPHSGLDNRYLHYYLRGKTFTDFVSTEMTGMAYPAISDTKLQFGPVPLPPTKEQHRIVAKVDQLMALCDELEERQEKKHHVSIQVNESALNTLTTADTPEALSESWKRVSNNFDLLYDSVENVVKLKQAMLQLAVQGKLVPQDPNDEPATVLLEAIKAERDRLLKEKKLKSSERLSSISPDEVPLDLPKGWVWCRLGEICDIGTGTTPPKGNRSYYDEGKIPWVNSSLTSQSLITKTDKSISELAAKECRLRTYPRGSLIIALYGQGKTRGQVSELAIDATVNQACAAIVFFEPFLFLRGYVLMVLKEKYEELRGLAAGGAQPNLNVGKIKETLIPLPPKPEQQRIVNRVDVLRALCDELDTNLTHAGEASEEMVEVVVRNVVG